MYSLVKIENIKFYPGGQAGLQSKTVTFSLYFTEPDATWSLSAEPFIREVAGLHPEEPLFGIKTGDWPGKFLVASDESSPFACWLAALITAFQRWARDPVGEGRVVSVSGGAISFALSWERQPVFTNALQFALRYLLYWALPHRVPENPVKLANDLNAWLEKAQTGGLSPNSLRFALAASERGIPVVTSPLTGTIMLGWGCHSIRMDSSFTDDTSVLAARLARNKFSVLPFLQKYYIPVPPGSVVFSREQAFNSAMQLKWPVVVKPSDRDQGEGVVTGIGDKQSLFKAFDEAIRLSPRGVIVEKQVEGDDFRLLVVGGKFIMAAQRNPGGITGDGSSTVNELVRKVNDDPIRGKSKRSLLIELVLDDEAIKCLKEQSLTPESVPETGRFVKLRRAANISRGGTAVDVTDQVHPDNIRLAERACRLIGLDIAGIDFISTDISLSWKETGGKIIEVNAQPGIRVHWLSNPDRDINGEIVDRLFMNRPARIPTAAITGTNGKTTTALMLYHIWMTSGRQTGVCTTNGLWIGNDLISTTNLSGYPGGRIMLEDPSLEAAVIELPRKGLIVFGHPCDRYDVAALLNVQDDHIGVDGINTMEEMLRLKTGVLERAKDAVIINAEDQLCLAMRKHAKAQRHILVARDKDNPAIKEHLNDNGDGVFTELLNGVAWIILSEGQGMNPLMPLQEIPATMDGLLSINETNALFAVALAWAQGIAPQTIRKAMSTFSNTAEHNPGRFNFIEGFNFKVLIDYAHNPDGIRELCDFVSRLPVSGKRRICNIYLGIRHKVHLADSASYLAKAFDYFVLGGDSDRLQNNSEWSGDDPLGKMIDYGKQCLIEHGVCSSDILTERDKDAVIRTLMASAQPGDLLVVLSGPWSSMKMLNAIRNELAG